MNSNSTQTFAKGGKILVKEVSNNGEVKKLHQDYQKFGRIGITDKYLIEASNDAGLQGVKFTQEELLKKVTASFEKLLEDYNDYIISKDSNGITFYIENQIETLERRGSSLEVVENERQKLNSEFERRKIIEEITQIQRDSLKQWIDYLSESDYPVPFKYLMLKAVLNYNYDLKLDKLFERTDETTRNITPFDAGTLSDLFYLNSNYLLLDYTKIMNENSTRILNSKEIIDETTNGKWIKFNGGSKTSTTDINTNAKELMQLVQNTYWCTKSAGKSQLEGGDFYVYVTQKFGEVLPQIAVRMNGDNVGELRGNESSAQDLSAEILSIAKDFLIKNIPNNSGQKWLDSIEYNERCVAIGKRFDEEGLYENFITEYLDLVAQKNKYSVDYGENGNVVSMIRKFESAKERLPNKYFDKGDIETNYNLISPKTKYFIGNLENYQISNLQSQGIDISDLSNWDLKYISGNLNCSNVIRNLGKVEFIGGDLTLSPITTDFGSVKNIGGNFNMSSAQITTMGNIESIGSGFAINSNLKDLGRLKKIGWLHIYSCGEDFTLGELEEITGDFTIEALDKDFDMGNLKKIGGNFYASKSLLTDLNKLESIGGDFSISGSKIKLFPNLKTIGGNADFSNNFASNTQNIESILGNVKFLNSRIMEFPKLNVIGKNIEFRGSYFKSFGNIKTIGGDVDLKESKIEELGNLEEINGFVSFEGSKVKKLNKLRKIVKFANFRNTDIDDLGDLESIGGNVYFNNKIQSIGKLKYVGGFAQFDGNLLLEKQFETIKNAK